MDFVSEMRTLAKKHPADSSCREGYETPDHEGRQAPARRRVREVRHPARSEGGHRGRGREAGREPRRASRSRSPRPPRCGTSTCRLYFELRRHKGSSRPPRRKRPSWRTPSTGAP
ncbi:MAG: hypothetical protein MZV64_28595 [Ignavibacteriales bacterium]|nr:hypothetical protein [Ignavibacteriales bacterium]